MEQESKDEQKNSINRVWEQRIIPNFSRACRTAEARELWWKGVAPKCRGQIWQLSFGNHLSVSPETFRLALQRAREIEVGVKKSPHMYPPRERELFESIRRDVSGTFPELKIFQVSAPTLLLGLLTFLGERAALPQLNQRSNGIFDVPE